MIPNPKVAVSADSRMDEAREATITRMGLRRGGWVGYNEVGIYVDQDNGERLKIRHGDVTQIELKTVEWDVVVMSLLLVAIGGYVGATQNPLVGIGFSVVGLASLYWSYRKRYKLVVRVEGERTPVSMYPTHPTECHETLAERVRINTGD